MNELSGYWLTKFIFQRALALVYLIAFIAAVNQFVPLLGENGLLPAPLFLQQVSFGSAPGIFHFFPHDAAFLIAGWLGVLLSLVALSGFSERYHNWFSAVIWGLLWVLYLSFVNAGQRFYSFGWESLLLEAGFFSIFLGGMRANPTDFMLWIFRWLLFRLMFGAGLIKLRGDTCWRDLTCLFWHYETQPMPNPLSWYVHHLPQWFHKAGVLFNHFAELIVPFGYFAPQPIAAIAGLLTIGFHGYLFATGNFSFLGLVTMVLAIPLLSNRVLTKLLPARLLPSAPATKPLSGLHTVLIYGLVIVVGILSIWPIQNLLSPRQAMNASFNPLHLVGTYGAFGSITRPRYELIVEGTAAEGDPTLLSGWREYEIRGKPGALDKLPPQVAPYHLRLGWLMWFEALNAGGGVESIRRGEPFPYAYNPWFINFLAKLLQNDERALGLLTHNPFPDQPPTYVRAHLYIYRFTTPQERKTTNNWWHRELVGEYFPAVSLENQEFRRILTGQGWLAK